MRKAFGDNPRQPSVIETVSKGGYRLIGHLRYPNSGHKKRAYSFEKGLPILLLLVIILLAFFLQGSPFKNTTSPPSITPLTRFHSLGIRSCYFS